jgi:hypothetical protein
VLGFRNGWQYTGRWVRQALHRRGVPFDEHATSGAKGAATRLSAALDAGQPAIIWPDRYLAAAAAPGGARRSPGDRVRRRR